MTRRDEWEDYPSRLLFAFLLGFALGLLLYAMERHYSAGVVFYTLARGTH